MKFSRRRFLALSAGAAASMGMRVDSAAASTNGSTPAALWRDLRGPVTPTIPEAQLWVPTLGPNLAQGTWQLAGGAAIEGQRYRLGTSDGLDTIFTEPIAIEPGATFSVSCEMAADVFPGQHLKLAVQALRGDTWENLLGISGAVGAANRWEEKVATFSMPSDATVVQAKILTASFGMSQEPIVVHDPHLQIGVGFRHRPAPKRTYRGAKATVRRDGSWIVENRPTFLTMMYADPARDLAQYREAGWNTIVNVETVDQLRRIADAGMWGMLSVSPWAWSGGWGAAGGPEAAVTRLEQAVSEMDATGELDRLIGIYWDNEDHSALDLNTAVMRRVSELLPGRPRWMLQGQYCSVPEVSALELTDAVGTYVGPENTGPAGGSNTGITVLEQLHYQELPVSVAQIQFGGDFESKVTNGSSQGARAVAFWRDGNGLDITSEPWWPRSAEILANAAASVGLNTA